MSRYDDFAERISAAQAKSGDNNREVNAVANALSSALAERWGVHGSSLQMLVDMDGDGRLSAAALRLGEDLVASATLSVSFFVGQRAFVPLTFHLTRAGMKARVEAGFEHSIGFPAAPNFDGLISDIEDSIERHVLAIEASVQRA